MGFISGCLHLPKGDHGLFFRKVTQPETKLFEFQSAKEFFGKANAIWQSFEVCKFGNKLNWFRSSLERIFSNAIKRTDCEYGKQSY